MALEGSNISLRTISKFSFIPMPHPTVINLHILSPSSVSVKSGFDHDTTKDTQGVPYQFWPKPITFVQTSIVQFNMDTLLIYKDDYNLSKLITLICNLKL